MLSLVQPIIRYRGRRVTAEDVSFIRSLIAANQKASRRRLSLALCEAWNWRQPNGQLCDAICRGLLLALHRSQAIQLPPSRSTGTSYSVHRTPPHPVLVDQSPLVATLKELQPLEILQVRRTSFEPLYDGLIEQFHYLRYCHPVGEHLKYVVFSSSRPIACFAFSSAPRHLGCRDRFIGWTAEQRKANIRLIAYNTRFLVLPWVRVRCLASHLLSRIARVVSDDWQRVYHHPLYFLETPLCQGSCRVSLAGGKPLGGTPRGIIAGRRSFFDEQLPKRVQGFNDHEVDLSRVTECNRPVQGGGDPPVDALPVAAGTWYSGAEGRGDDTTESGRLERRREIGCAVGI